MCSLEKKRPDSESFVGSTCWPGAQHFQLIKKQHVFSVILVWFQSWEPDKICRFTDCKQTQGTRLLGWHMNYKTQVACIYHSIPVLQRRMNQLLYFRTSLSGSSSSVSRSTSSETGDRWIRWRSWTASSWCASRARTFLTFTTRE